MGLNLAIVIVLFPAWVYLIGAAVAVLRFGRRTPSLTLPKSPSPPFRGEREGPVAQRWEGEVGLGAGLWNLHLTPTLSAPRGGEGDLRLGAPSRDIDAERPAA
jgi:hypothetical protein